MSNVRFFRLLLVEKFWKCLLLFTLNFCLSSKYNLNIIACVSLQSFRMAFWFSFKKLGLLISLLCIVIFLFLCITYNYQFMFSFLLYPSYWQPVAAAICGSCNLFVYYSCTTYYSWIFIWSIIRYYFHNVVDYFYSCTYPPIQMEC